jgi:hypothetical protein
MRPASKTLSLVVAAAACLAAPDANAGLVVSGSVGGAPTGVVKENFDALTPGTAATTLLPSGIVISYRPDAQAVSGSSSGLYAAPFLSGGNGLGFGSGGSTQPGGADATTYITSGSYGSVSGAVVSLQLPALERYFGILWGSVDNYNTLSFYNGATLVGAITGSDVTASPNGDQGVNGTLYVNIDATGGSTFDRVVATSGQYAFEFDNVAFNQIARAEIASVPEPVGLSLLATGLLGMLFARRRRVT